MKDNEQNEVLNINITHSLDEALRLASLFPKQEELMTEETFDIDGALA